MSKFSFIIPIYNCEKYLKTCVNCIKKIHLKNYEVILVDDGSYDKSGYVCDELESENKEVRCLHQENQGVSAARNCGIQQASGDYIIFLDADDSIEPDKLGRILSAVESNTKIDLAIYGLSFDYYNHGQCYRRDELAYPVNGCMNREQWLNDFESLYEMNALSPIWNKVYRREILLKNQLEFNKDMFLYEDLDFSIRYMACCDIICNFPDIIYHYRQTEDEGNAGRRLKRIENLTDVVNKIENALNWLIDDKTEEKQKNEFIGILLSLYVVLANEKIKVSNVKEIRKICDDFSVWFSDRKIDVPKQSQTFVEQILKRNAYYFVFRRHYIFLRHKIAVWIKNLKFYQKKNGKNYEG